MGQATFFSWARITSQSYAEAPPQNLGDQVFLDALDIEAGKRFVEACVKALLHAKVVFVLLDIRELLRCHCG